MSEVNNIVESILLRSPKIWRILLVLVGGILILICAGSWVSPRPDALSQNNSIMAAESGNNTEGGGTLAAAESDLERRLEAILGSIAGCGEVQVTVTMAAGPEYVYAQNISKQSRTTEEQDQSGGNRLTTEVNEDGNLVLLRAVSGGKEEPVLIKSTRPEIAGVLVLAEGAQNPSLREGLMRAVATVLAVPAHKITVLPKEGG
jgi:stage III sporulation protein AG